MRAPGKEPRRTSHIRRAKKKKKKLIFFSWGTDITISNPKRGTDSETQKGGGKKRG